MHKGFKTTLPTNYKKKQRQKKRDLMKNRKRGIEIMINKVKKE